MSNSPNAPSHSDVEAKRAAVRRLLEERARKIKTAPLSSAQQRLWFWEQFAPGTSLYNIPCVVRLSGALDMAALQESLDALIRRHESLRTAIRAESGIPLQFVLPPEPFAFPRVDLSDNPEPLREGAFARLVSEETSQPIDLTVGRPLRARLVRLSNDEHRLVLTLHHVAVDAWSVSVLVRELCELYRAASAGTQANLPELAIQYADFAVWQAEWLRSDEAKSQLAYWTERLRGAPTQLDLPEDRRRQGAREMRGAKHVITIPRALVDAVDRVTRAARATRFMTLLTAFKTLMFRYTHQEDMVVGTPIANRNQSELEGVVGFFVNTLAVRTRLSGHHSFKRVLEAVRDGALEAYQHQDVPFDMVVDALRIDRTLSRSPLFQVMFAMQDSSQLRAELPNLTLTVHETETRTALFDLLLTVSDSKDGLVAVWEYAEDVFDSTTVARIADNYVALLADVTSNPDARIDAISLVGAAERERLLVEWNDTQVALPAAASMQQVFEEQAARHPDAVAARYGDTSLTYAELDRLANQLAHRLRRLGVGAESLVGTHLPHGLEVPIAYLAVLKAGGVIVPIPEGTPPRRLQSLVDGAGVRVVLSTRSTIAIDALACQVLLLDEERSSLAAEPTEPPPVVTSLENAAYVIYTSGSTGIPKGAVISHGAILNRILWGQTKHPLGVGDKVLQFSSLGFDASMWEIWAAFAGGAELALVSSDSRHDISQLPGLIERLRITSISLVPSVLQVLLPEVRGAELETLRLVFCGGETLTPALRNAFLDCCSGQLVNIYGATEAAIDTTCDTCVAGSNPDVVPIGRPIGNSQVYVLDRYLRPVPTGVVGEIYFGGAGLGRGYLGDPALTAERFVPDPFHDVGLRLYRSGDRGKYLPDGRLVFAGRSDRQVKLRGIRIELGEIESVLLSHPDVRETLVRFHDPDISRSSVDPTVAAFPHVATSAIASVLEELERMPDRDELAVQCETTIGTFANATNVVKS